MKTCASHVECIWIDVSSSLDQKPSRCSFDVPTELVKTSEVHNEPSTFVDGLNMCTLISETLFVLSRVPWVRNYFSIVLQVYLGSLINITISKHHLDVLFYKIKLELNSYTLKKKLYEFEANLFPMRCENHRVFQRYNHQLCFRKRILIYEIEQIISASIYLS